MKRGERVHMKFDRWARFGNSRGDDIVSIDPRAIGESGEVTRIDRVLEECSITGVINAEFFGDTVLRGVRL